MVNSSECLSAEVVGHASVPWKRTGKHFDLINAKRTSSEALRPIFPKMLLKALFSFVLGKRAMNLTELSW